MAQKNSARSGIASRIFISGGRKAGRFGEEASVANAQMFMASETSFLNGTGKG